MKEQKEQKEQNEPREQGNGIKVKNKDFFAKTNTNKNGVKPDKKPNNFNPGAENNNIAKPPKPPKELKEPKEPKEPEIFGMPKKQKQKNKHFGKKDNKRGAGRMHAGIAAEDYLNKLRDGAYRDPDLEPELEPEFGFAPETNAGGPDMIMQDDSGENASDLAGSAGSAEPAEPEPTVDIVGIRYKPVGKIYFFAPDGEQYMINDKIMVETSRGLELGYVAIPNKKIGVSKVTQPLKHVLRRASDEDAERAEKNRISAKETIRMANERIRFYNLQDMKMKLVNAEYSFDGTKLTYYFTAEGRVDFRDLVKDLASIFKTRIEMRQIGIRDQTKILGGLSICGRQFCCNSFLQDFEQVTIKMAKEQNLQINSSKISGACGRLMCCLKYEHEAYNYLSKDMPKINSIVETSSGETGTVVEGNILTGVCKVKINHKSGADSHETVIKHFPKKNLKIIGVMKNDREQLYGAEEQIPNNK